MLVIIMEPKIKVSLASQTLFYPHDNCNKFKWVWYHNAGRKCEERESGQM